MIRAKDIYGMIVIDHEPQDNEIKKCECHNDKWDIVFPITVLVLLLLFTYFILVPKINRHIEEQNNKNHIEEVLDKSYEGVFKK